MMDSMERLFCVVGHAGVKMCNICSEEVFFSICGSAVNVSISMKWVMQEEVNSLKPVAAIHIYLISTFLKISKFLKIHP